ncbi:MAG TPA: DNA-formamidopyrimidine glycosylase family protein [Ilumatobacter sp.]|nr:DNA-formamidopyrimidine glycosylase family protein [Ilumatobacter sp.]
MPELPEVQAHAERLAADYTGRVLKRFQPLTFTALKTAAPSPDAAYGQAVTGVGRRGKFILLDFESVQFAVHLMQGGRLLVDPKQSAKPRGGQARFVFDEGPALLLTEAGTERRAGVWVYAAGEALDSPPLSELGTEADHVTPEEMLRLFQARNQRLHGFLRDQHAVAGLGRRLANEICHTARLSPFSMTGKLGIEGATKVVSAIRECVDEGLAYERTRDDMSASKDRPGAVHGRTGEPCPVCGDIVRAVEYSGYTVNYCPTCQTGGKVLADNTTSKFLK